MEGGMEGGGGFKDMKYKIMAERLTVKSCSPTLLGRNRTELTGNGLLTAGKPMAQLCRPSKVRPRWSEGLLPQIPHGHLGRASLRRVC